MPEQHNFVQNFHLRHLVMVSVPTATGLLLWLAWRRWRRSDINTRPNEKKKSPSGKIIMEMDTNQEKDIETSLDNPVMLVTTPVGSDIVEVISVESHDQFGPDHHISKEEAIHLMHSESEGFNVLSDSNADNYHLDKKICNSTEVTHSDVVMGERFSGKVLKAKVLVDTHFSADGMLHSQIDGAHEQSHRDEQWLIGGDELFDHWTDDDDDEQQYDSEDDEENVSEAEAGIGHRYSEDETCSTVRSGEPVVNEEETCCTVGSCEPVINEEETCSTVGSGEPAEILCKEQLQEQAKEMGKVSFDNEDGEVKEPEIEGQIAVVECKTQDELLNQEIGCIVANEIENAVIESPLGIEVVNADIVEDTSRKCVPDATVESCSTAFSQSESAEEVHTESISEDTTCQSQLDNSSVHAQHTDGLGTDSAQNMTDKRIQITPNQDPDPINDLDPITSEESISWGDLAENTSTQYPEWSSAEDTVDYMAGGDDSHSAIAHNIPMQNRGGGDASHLNESGACGGVAGNDEEVDSSGIGSSSEKADSGVQSGVSSDSGTPANYLQKTSYHFDLPSDLCGLLIGSQGRNINQLEENTGTSILVRDRLGDPSMKVVRVNGTRQQIDIALGMLKKRFPFRNFKVSFEETEPDPPLLCPSLSQLTIPYEVEVPVIVSSVVSVNHVFVQLPMQESFHQLPQLSIEMNNCYNNSSSADMPPGIPLPPRVGMVCVAQVQTNWLRCQVVFVHHNTNLVDVRFVDFGGYQRKDVLELRQMRTDFTYLPFQAIECYLASVLPLNGSDFFTAQAHQYFTKQVQSTLLYAVVVGEEKDKLPYIWLYKCLQDSAAPSTSVLLNRLMVDMGHASWQE